MTDIQKIIEEEAKNFMDRNVVFGCASTDIQDAFRGKAFISGANFALSQLQHANRWRKVSELSEINRFPLHIIVRVPDENEQYYYTVTYLKDKKVLDVINYTIRIETEKDCAYSDIIQWKPIE